MADQMQTVFQVKLWKQTTNSQIFLRIRFIKF